MEPTLEKLTDDQLTRLARLARRQAQLEDEIADLAAQSEAKAKELRQVAEVDVPGLLDETGLSEVRLADGTKVVVKEDVRVSTTGKWRDAINAWLVARDLEDMIKDKVTVAFAKEQGGLAKATLEFLRGLGLTAVDRVRSVNPQSFAALVRELREAGEDVPLDDLGVFIQKRSKLERPKS